MRTLALTTLLALAACKGDSGSTPTGNSTGAETGTPSGTTNPTVTGGNGKISASCIAQVDNVLRYDCTVTTTTAGAVDAEWEAADGTLRSTASTTTGTDHLVTLYAMKPGQTYEVRISGADGTATLQVTPDAFPLALSATASGNGSTPVLTSIGCGGEQNVVIWDTDGEPLWYHVYGGMGGDGGAVFTPDHTVLTGYRHEVVETALDGSEILRFSRGIDFGDDPLHHDVHKSENGLIYALFAEVVPEGVTTYVLDGVHIFDESGLIDSWHLADVISPSGGGQGGGFWNDEFPNSVDWSHGNSVHGAADGSMYLSMRWLSAGLKVDGDPSSPTFGELQWALVGEQGLPVASDFALTSSIGAASDFIGQHHFSPTPDGRYSMFDNRQTGSSRGIVVDIDEAGGTADIVESWDVGRICQIQGSTYVLENGNTLVTCPSSLKVEEFQSGSASSVWSLEVSCASSGGPGPGGMIPRGIPAPL